MKVMVIILSLMVLFSGTSIARSETYMTHHPLYRKILRINPALDAQYAEHLTKAILSVSARHKLNPRKLTAILAQECRFRLDCINPVSHDYGIGQINHKTIRAYGFDRDKLLTDLWYSVSASAIVLADFKRMYASKEKDFWTRYNSSNPEKRELYAQAVSRYF